VFVEEIKSLPFVKIQIDNTKCWNKNERGEKSREEKRSFEMLEDGSAKQEGNDVKDKCAQEEGEGRLEDGIDV